jgi:hypothetical protein
MDWENAKKHLDEVRIAYTEIGASGLLGLNFSINPLLVRYEKGERTQELYESIMSLE